MQQRQSPKVAPDRSPAQASSDVSRLAPLRAPEGAPFVLIAEWHDRVRIAAPPGARLVLDGEPFLPGSEGFCDVNLIAEGALEDVGRHWLTYHDDAAATLGSDLAPEWTLADGHTLYLHLDVARRGRLDQVDLCYRDPTLGEALPVAPGPMRWSARLATHRGVSEVRIEFYDASDRYVLAVPSTVPEAFGGRRPDGYALCGGRVVVPAGAVSVRFKVGLTPLADANDAVLFMTDVRLAATTDAPDRATAERRCPLGDVLTRLADGTLVTYEARLATIPLNAPDRPIVVWGDGVSYPLGQRRGADAGASLTARDHLLLIDTADHKGRLTLLVDGRWVQEVLAAPGAEARRFEARFPPEMLDGAPHLVELVAFNRILATIFAAVPPHATPWRRIVGEVTPPAPAHHSPMLRARYRAFLVQARLAAQGRQGPFVADKLACLHDALTTQKPKPFPLVFETVETPVVSLLLAVDDLDAHFGLLASLLFAPAGAPFELIVALPHGAVTQHQGIVVETRSGDAIEAINAAARRARGRYLAVLNGVQEVSEGWLATLIAPFETGTATGAPIGLTGAMLIDDAVRLVAAGAALQDDGALAVVGRGANPHEPRYAYRRVVEALPLAGLVTRTDLWRELGGLAEATDQPTGGRMASDLTGGDFALRASDAGHASLYCADAVIVGAAQPGGGEDVAAFRRRFAGHRPTPVERRHDPAARARVLFVLLEIPRTDVDAASVAAVEEIRLIQALGGRVTLVPRNMEFLPRYADQMQAMGVEVLHAPFHLSMDDVLSARGSEFDAIYVTRFQVAEALLPAVRKYAPQAKLLLNLADLHFLRQMRAAALSQDAEALRAAEGVRAREVAVMRQADVVLSYSDVEASVAFSHAGPRVPIAKVPWVKRPREEVAGFAERKGCCFLGNFRHPPNAEAVRWFAHEVAPLIRARREDVVLTVYGAYAEETLGTLAGVEVAGHASDLEAMFDAHRLFVAPLRSGAGVKGKVFEAMSSGIATILSPVAAEGIAVRDGVEALICEDGAAFAEAILATHDDEARWSALTDAARALLRERYEFASGLKAMRAAFGAAGITLPLASELAERGTGPAAHPAKNLASPPAEA